MFSDTSNEAVGFEPPTSNEKSVIRYSHTITKTVN